MKYYFSLSVDTEEEWNWNGDLPRVPFSLRNIEKIPEFQSFCTNIGIRPTYFIDYAVADHPDCVKKFLPALEKGDCEIAAHLHPWCNPPVTETISSANSHIVNLPLDLVARKLETLTRKISDAFGIRPKSFRSGRWGMNGRILKLLSEMGYEVDSSIRPLYSDHDFSYEKAPLLPYWPDFQNHLQPGEQRSLIEIPPSAGYHKPNFEKMDSLHKFLATPPWSKLRLIGILWHTGIMKRIHYTPEGTGVKELKQYGRAAVQRNQYLIHMFLHSSSLLPGCSPYVSDKKELSRFYEKIEEAVSQIHQDCQSSGKVDLQYITLCQGKKAFEEENRI